MTISQKVLIFLGSSVILGLLIFIVVQQVQTHNRVKAMETSMVQQLDIADHIQRSQAEYVSKKDLEDFAKENNVNLSAIQKDMGKLGANVDGINSVLVSSSGYHATGISSTGHTANPNASVNPTVECDGHSITCPNPDTFGYLQNGQTLALNEKFGQIAVPVGQVGFEAWKAEPWTVDMHSRNYHLTTVTGKDEEGREYTYNKFSVTTNGETFDVVIQNSEFKQEYPTSHFSIWNPRLFLGVGLGADITAVTPELVPNLNVGIMSYGQFKNQPDWTFLNLGAGYAAASHTLTGTVAPVMYNVGKHIPLMNNLYVGPVLGYTTRGDFILMGGINVGL
jgi:hypothetical protein